MIIIIQIQGLTLPISLYTSGHAIWSINLYIDQSMYQLHTTWLINLHT